MDGSNWATIIVAIVSVGSAYLAGRAARSAAKHTSDASVMNSRTQAETEAYNRARNMDMQTIERQEKELEKLRSRVTILEQNEERLNEDNDRLRSRLTRLERLETRLNELGYSLD